MPVTTRVVQIEPGPMPTLMASTPASMSASAAAGGGDVAADERAVPHAPQLADGGLHAVGVAVGGVDHDARRRRPRSGPWPDRRRRARCRPRRRPGGDPTASLVASGKSIFFWMSLTVMRPRSTPSPSTTGSFSMRFWRKMSCACSRVVPTGTVTRFSLVMIESMATSTWSSSEPAQVAVGEDAHQAVGVVGDRDARDVEVGHQVEGLGHPVVRAQRDRVGDHPGLGALHPVDLGGLVVGATGCGGSRRCRRGGRGRWPCGPR